MLLMTSYASRQNSCDRLDMVQWFNELIKSKTIGVHIKVAAEDRSATNRK